MQMQIQGEDLMEEKRERREKKVHHKRAKEKKDAHLDSHQSQAVFFQL